MNLINPYRFNQSRPSPLIATNHYEWYLDRARNSINQVLAYDTGNLGAELDLINPALSNKPTQTSINGKIAYKGDAIDDILIKENVIDFGRSYPNWMAHFVIDYDAANLYTMMSCYNTANANKEGFRFFLNSTTIAIETTNSAGTNTYPMTFGSTTGGGKIIISFVYTGTNRQIYTNGVMRTNNAVGSNPLLIPSTTNNLSVIGNLWANSQTLNATACNEGYASFSDYNPTDFTNAINTLKATYGII
ncbi:MAG: hypothetical protein PHT69_02110 [Bacteroidales bacterium]|nr:hypothetical protein [Bacteroidales bacterium]